MQITKLSSTLRFSALILLLACVLSLFSCRRIETAYHQESSYCDASSDSKHTQSDSTILQIDSTAPPTDDSKPPDITPAGSATPTPEVRINMVGDILMHTKVVNSGILADGSYSYDHIFKNVKKHIESADISIANQEVILGGTALGLSDYPLFNGPYEMGDSLVNAGFDIILHATNHALDKGKQGVLNCIDFWTTAHPETEVLGIHLTEEEQNDIYVREENGIRIAFLNYTFSTNGIPIPSDMPYIVDILNSKRLRADIAKAEEIADFTVVLPHWGTEYSLSPDADQKYWTTIMFESGADLVIGTHPHVIQPVELIENNSHSMLVYYSIGNFVNSTAQAGRGIANRMVGAIADITIRMDENGNAYISDYGVTPIVCHVRNETQKLTVYKLSDYTEELANENEIIHSDPDFSLEYCEELVKKVFGNVAN